MIYSKYLEEKDKDVTAISLIKSVIHMGISRHIRVMLNVVNDQSHNDALNIHSKSQLLEWTISSNSNINEIHFLKYINAENVSLVKDWYNERQVFQSQISEHICETQSEFITDSIVPRILKQMDLSAQNCQTDEKSKAISWLLSEICKAMEEEDSGATWEPILVGSAAECTQTLFIDEFDYVLFTNSALDDINDINRTLNTVVSSIKKHA